MLTHGRPLAKTAEATNVAAERPDTAPRLVRDINGTPPTVSENGDCMARNILLALGLIAVLGLSVWFAAQAWFSVDTQMSGHGWFALILGVVLSLVLGIGLMWLVFHSSRSGHDDIDRDF